MNKKPSSKPTAEPTALELAKKFPPPTPGLQIASMPLAVFVEYVKLYDLTMDGYVNGKMKLRIKSTPLDVAKQLSTIGE